MASQLSQCGGAGTGCGWCVPFLRQLFDDAGAGPLEQLTPAEYARRRAEYIRAGKGKPPAGREANGSLTAPVGSLLDLTPPAPLSRRERGEQDRIRGDVTTSDIASCSPSPCGRGGWGVRSSRDHQGLLDCR